jgi:hypothetical protein
MFFKIVKLLPQIFIEPLSRNDFLFVYGSKLGNYEEKENGQTADFDNLSALAPPTVELLNLRKGFKAVVKLIENNRDWLDVLMETTIFTRQNHNVER